MGHGMMSTHGYASTQKHNPVPPGRWFPWRAGALLGCSTVIFGAVLILIHAVLAHLRGGTVKQNSQQQYPDIKPNTLVSWFADGEKCYGIVRRRKDEAYADVENGTVGGMKCSNLRKADHVNYEGKVCIVLSADAQSEPFNVVLKKPDRSLVTVPVAELTAFYGTGNGEVFSV